MPITVAFAHATGFCGAVWRPVVETLGTDFDTIVWDFPNHGSSPRVPPPVDWWLFGEWARDHVAAASHPLIGVGHSMGGAALAMAEIIAPGTFAGLILIEPMLFPPPYQRADNHLSLAVTKRRRSFATRAEARENFASKPPFENWHPGALDGYIEDGLLETENGTVILSCTPEDEADVYRGATAHGAWERIEEVKTPTLILAGSESDTHPKERVHAIASHFLRAGFEIVPAENHFLPMEKPGLVARRIARMAHAVQGSDVESAEPSPREPDPAEPEPRTPKLPH